MGSEIFGAAVVEIICGRFVIHLCCLWLRRVDIATAHHAHDCISQEERACNAVAANDSLAMLSW